MSHGHAPHQQHRASAPGSVAAAVVTCSDTRTPETDQTGAAIRAALEAAGHAVVLHRVVRDDVAEIRAAVDQALAAGARAVLVNGGTGAAPRDVAVEALRPLFDKELPGFGELFRMLSFEQVGSAAWLSRATAGTHRGAVLFALPGSPRAVGLALDRLILPELGHLVRELSR
ncbi:MAG: molybdenum cofactor biosynthesis protein MoaB [Deltaproteobacteria bacterium]|nr:molybdenum cofactor biosynthesis protein MoaB [Deltaproteobacteria bacterium]